MFPNILTSIFGNNYSCHYFRYVDDILAIGHKQHIYELEKFLSNRLKELDLETHKPSSEKTFLNTADKPFEYLGYRFELPKITVRQSTMDKFIASIAAKFSEYRHSKSRQTKDKHYLNEDKLKYIFLEELNEKITGAISKNKRYGWIFYFNAINDMSTLHNIDSIIRKLFKRLDNFDNCPPQNLKKISRAYYEIKDPRKINNGYIHNYDNYRDTSGQKAFLDRRGHIDPNNNYSNSDIKKIYERVMLGYLSQLEKDDVNIY